MTTHKMRLLLVEDDAALAALLQEYLEAVDYEVTYHARGDTAIELLKNQSFDIILSDLMLPGADGREILRAVRGNPARTLIFLMTGYSGIEDALHALEQGAYDFISKPFQLPEVLVRLNNGARYQALLRSIEQNKEEPEPSDMHETISTPVHTAAETYDSLNAAGSHV